MKSTRIALLILAFVLGVSARSQFLSSARNSNGQEDPKSLLERAKAGISNNPNSAFWHNQAAVAYDALGDFDSAVRELKLASNLDPDDPSQQYALFGLYKRKGMLREQREALLAALEIDGNNPLGHFELGVVLEKEQYLEESLREYDTAKHLIEAVKGNRYTDRRGGVYEIPYVRRHVGEYIERVRKAIAAKTHENRG